VAYLSCICDCQLRLLLNFGKTKISYICSFVGLVVHLIGCSLFVNKMGKGIYGTAVSGTFSYFIMYTIMIVYGSYQEDLKEVLVFPDSRTFCCPINGLYDYIKISGKTTITTILDCIVWHLMLL